MHKWEDRGSKTSVEEVMTDVVGAAGALKLTMETRDEVRLNYYNFMLNLFPHLFLKHYSYR
jgi:hypothetical protein